MKPLKKTYPAIVIVLNLIFMNNATVGQIIQNEQYKNFVIINPIDTPEQIIEKAANVLPSPRQYEWQKLEMTGFVHFGINTFDEVEWGKKETDITQFNPQQIDVKQWVNVFKEAGFKLIILTTKHHDGFCLWPTKCTDYNISNTPFQNGKGDIVGDLSNACREAGIKFGVYLSPWDIHEKTYGTPEYNTYFMNQLTELLTNYCEISEVWFDGACGEGPNGKKQIYDWNSYYALIRKLQPNAVIAVSGPDVRWVGTESGYGRQTEWSVLPGSNLDQNAIAANSQQQAVEGAFIPHDLMDEDLGSREKLKNASSLIWYPAEIDVSIRPGWFYHENEDELVKTPQKLVDIYFNSIGLNGVLLLNIPPDTRGLIHENDIKSLQEMRYILDETFKENFTANAQVRTTNELPGNEVKFILDNDPATYWTTDKALNTASIEVQLTRGRTFNCILLQENILKGQRIEKFRLEYWDGQLYRTFVKGTTIGYKRLLKFPDVYADRVKLVIEQCRTNPTLSSLGIFKTPPEIVFELNSCAFEENMNVKISSDSKRAKIYYTLDGTIPTEKSNLYSGEVSLTNSTVVTAVAISSDGKKSLPVSAGFNKAKYSIEYKTPHSEKYPGAGKFTLVDGVSAAANFNNGKWQGFNGTDVDVVVDLREIKSVTKVAAGFLRDENSYIFLPSSVEYSFSDDGINFSSPIEIKNEEPQNNKEKISKTFACKADNVKARYIRIAAHNIGVCPAWHKGAGDKAWLFCDEISVE
ncbi:MAG: alpha-L-fucosidase [bacterium]